jgi:hypothetical protein
LVTLFILAPNNFFRKGTHDMGGIKVIGQDASFDSSSSCWAWWPGKVSSLLYAAECIDGKSGFLINYDDPSNDPCVSEISNQSYILSVVGVLRQIGHPKVLSPTSLDEVAFLKHQLSPDYEAAKEDLLRHRVFREWSSRHKKV